MKQRMISFCGLAFTVLLCLAACGKKAAAPKPAPEAGATLVRDTCYAETTLVAGPVTIPLCGFLAPGDQQEVAYETRYNLTLAGTDFVVPRHQRAPGILRFNLSDETGQRLPLEVLMGEWVCITAGEIAELPRQQGPGLVRARAVALDSAVLKAR